MQGPDDEKAQTP